ncbi:unnamed protein product [Urochloa decumbens]|uniref:Uncharacterized protein n=1 Tax=Urochloa decumbens TaxID=240449 RepID=A0ABC9ENP6_9POAL
MAAASTSAGGRRHVRLCFTDHRDQTYALHHIDVDPLFRSEPADPDPESMDALPLPPPAARFQPPPEPNHVMNFHPLGDRRVVSIDELRRTLIYDAANGAVRAGPALRDRKWYTLSATVPGAGAEDNLYLLDHIPLRERRRCFEALVYEPHREDWSWHKLPQPPYVRDPGYAGARVVSHAVAGSGAVWTYTQGVGTYSFDTARRAWRKEGDWALPFRGKAVRDGQPGGGCGLWFGISSAPDGRLVAADLATATATSPPEVRGTFEDLRPPGEWFCRNAAVVHVGCGRLCTVRFFATDPTDKLWKTRGTVVVITAVEVGCDGDDGGIRMVRRRSACIKIPDYNRLINWVL